MIDYGGKCTIAAACFCCALISRTLAFLHQPFIHCTNFRDWNVTLLCLGILPKPLRATSPDATPFSTQVEVSIFTLGKNVSRYGGACACESAHSFSVYRIRQKILITFMARPLTRYTFSSAVNYNRSFHLKTIKSVCKCLQAFRIIIVNH